jgi:small GTP-binding protein
MDNAFEERFKFVIIGDSGVGKSSFINRYTENVFSDKQESTFYIDFKVRTIIKDNKKIKLYLWDTAGQEKYKSMVTTYFRNAQCFLVMFDITNTKSFMNVKSWLDLIFCNKSIDNPLIILIGTKNDLKHIREVGIELVSEYIRNYGIRYFEISSKTNYGIEAIFDYAVDILLERFIYNNNNNNIIIKSKKEINKTKKEEKYNMCC